MEPDFLVEQLDSLQDLDNLEESIVQDKEIKNKLTTKLMSVGGTDIKDGVKNIMRRVMTNELMSKLNMSGHRGKIPFKDYTIFKVINDVALKAFNGTEKEVKEIVSRTLKYAPDRAGGGGRNK